MTRHVEADLRLYQHKIIDFVLDHEYAAILVDMALGKTISLLTALLRMWHSGVLQPGDTVLVIAPIRVARTVWHKEVADWEHTHNLRVSLILGNVKQRVAAMKVTANIYVTNVENVPWLFNVALPQYVRKYKRFPWKVLALDECFPAGTLVTTPFGPIPIEELRAGDEVSTSCGVKEIVRTASRTVDTLVELILSNGVKLQCTQEHPIFTARGWLPAYLTQGEILYAESDLSALQETVHVQIRSDSPRWESEMLLEVLRSEAQVGEFYDIEEKVYRSEDECQLHLSRAVEQRQAVAKSLQKTPIENRQTARTRLQRETWRQWQRSVTVRKAFSNSAAGRVYLELCNRISPVAARLSYELQSGLWKPETETSDRSGRQQPQQYRTAGSRPEENETAKKIRVESVTHIEPGCPKDVFNLVIKDCPHFFANGVLVHNSSKFKHSSTERFKAIKHKLKFFKRRYLLTGTPRTKSLLNLWSQIYILDEGQRLGTSFSRFKERFFISTDYERRHWEVREGANEYVQRLIQDITIRMDAKDWLELPPVLGLDDPMWVDLEPRERAMYDQFEREMYVRLDEQKELIVFNAATVSGKCHQFANGAVYYDPERRADYHVVHDLKLDALEEVLGECTGNVMIAYHFRHDLERIRKRLHPLVIPTLKDDTEHMVEQWNAGKLPILAVHPQSVAHGLNLQFGGNTITSFSQTWSAEDFIQLIFRLRRPGQAADHIMMRPILARDTVDEAIFTSNERGIADERGFLDALNTYRFVKEILA